jgi:hypothetical protein
MNMANDNHGALKDKVRGLMANYDTQADEVEACKSALETSKRKASDIVRSVYETTKKKNFTYDGKALKIKIRHKDKENPDFNTATFFFQGASEEAFDLDSDE